MMIWLVLIFPPIAALVLHAVACGLHVEAVDAARMKRDWFYSYCRAVSWPIRRFI